MESQRKKAGPRGRGTGSNPGNRFEILHLDKDPEEAPEGPLPTQFFQDHSRSIISRNASPDVGFSASLNPYRGCEHGCIYCYARPTHEYLGFSAGLDFETKIMVKQDAAELLRKEFLAKKWQPQVLALSGVTDPYQPVERRLQLTRRCLEVCRDFLNPVAIVTKNHLVTRDIDILSELAAHEAAVVYVSVTTLNTELARILEPRTSSPIHRLEAIRELTAAGIPAGVMVAPVIPAINDSEIPKILEAAAKAGARMAGYVMLRLPHGVKELFSDWLERHFPDRKEKVLHRIQEIRGGRLNDPNFRTRMRGEGVFAEQVAKLFELGRKKAGLNKKNFELSTAFFRRTTNSQMDLFLPSLRKIS